MLSQDLGKLKVRAIGSMFLFLDHVLRYQVSLWSKILICRIEEVSLEAWLIVGALVIVAVGAVAITWIALIVRICRIYCYHRKAEVRAGE